MHAFIHLLASDPSTTTKSSKGGGSSSLTLLIIIALFAVVYLFFIRPRSQRMRQQQAAAGKEISVGAEVMSAGGIYGRVVAIDSDVVEVEVAPGTVLSFTRRAISLRPAPTGAASAGAAATPATGPIDDEWETPPAIEEHQQAEPPKDDRPDPESAGPEAGSPS